MKNILAYNSLFQLYLNVYFELIVTRLSNVQVKYTS